MRRILSLWFPMLSVERWHRQTKYASKTKKSLPVPIVLTDYINGVCFVSDANHDALASGVTPRMSLADARALEPNLKIVPADPRADTSMLGKIANWATRYTPWVAICGRDGLWLDISGCAHLLGGEEAMIKDLTVHLSNFGFTSRFSIADTPGAAWAMAHYGGEEKLIAPDAQRLALASLPVIALRIGDIKAVELIRLGISSIGDLYALPRAAIAKRFGMVISERLDQALGLMPEPISPRRPLPKYRAECSFLEPVSRKDNIESCLLQLLEDICSNLECASQGVRQLILDLFLVEGATKTLHVGTVRPVREAKCIAKLFAEPLSKIDSGFGIETMILSAQVVEPLTESQINVLVDERNEEIVPLASLLDRLGSRLNFEHVTRLVPKASHLPDHAMRQVSVAESNMHGFWPETQIRPLVLLDQPESVESITGIAYYQPPEVFRWRQNRYSVRATEGPERIAPEWWRRDRAWARGLRDYWRVEAEEGRRFWLFCEGRRDRQCNSLRWYLHGFFA